ncbi:dicarboxylate/amino acid:cation symporter [Croceibacterium sp. TMG7-5b_MA50]|uniref:dicarboxylate/amino acid:cation symporter n=1 Tax=Croceibacterium sp. TMG7-5b_MA50 TaxID=3121290 RepID=UPI003221B155
MPHLLRRWLAVPLWQRVVGALLAGVALGLLWPAGATGIAVLGELFVRLIRMLVVPVVFVSLSAGVAALGDPKRLGSVGGRTVALFAFTTLCAVAIGMALGLLVQPGAGAAIGSATDFALGTPVSVHDQLVGIVPLNIVAALMDGDMLAIIFFAVLLGCGIVLAGDEGRPLAAVLESAGRVLFRLVGVVMELTPFGVLALIANAVAANGVAVFANIALLALCVAAGVLAQIVAVHLPLLRLVARRGLVRFFRDAADALVVAFSTASSAATLPVALRIAVEDMRLLPAVAGTVLPVGASIGKDGTAMYVGLLAVFSLQALGYQPDLLTLLLVLGTGALAAFGTAPIPSASLFMLAAVLSAVGVPGEQTALVVGFVLPFDRLLDMTRTVASANANLTVTACVARLDAG